jgi:beta-lactam-binding protein with PASTA domain
MVILQDTEAGTWAKKDSQMTLTVSLGKKPSTASGKKVKQEETGWIWKAID